MTTDSPDLHDPSFNLSPEVVADPILLISLSGLDAVHNATHKIIWESFSSTGRTADRLPIVYRLLPADHEFSMSKIKKSYEYDTIPGGILKRNWIRKHMYVGRAVCGIGVGRSGLCGEEDCVLKQDRDDSREFAWTKCANCSGSESGAPAHDPCW